MNMQEREELKIRKINETVDELKWMMVSRQIPLTVSSFSELHNYCDANMLGNSDELWTLGLKEDGHENTEVIDLLNEIQDAVDGYIKSVYFEGWKQRLNKGGQL